MDSETAHRMRCLQQIQKVIAKANETLAGISQPSVCREVLLSAPGTAYVLGLSEVYQVSRRLAHGMRAQRVASDRLQQALREVDLAWNNLLSFLALGPATFQRLNLQRLEAPLGTDPCLPVPPLQPAQLCGVCLTGMKQEPQEPSGNSDPVTFQGSCYHASCANFWLNCVDVTLPGQT